MMSQTATHRVKEWSKYITNTDGRFKQQQLNTHSQKPTNTYELLNGLN